MKRRVLFIMDGMGGGGAERVLITLLGNIDPERFDVTLLLINRKGVYLNQIPSHVRVLGMYSRPGTPAYRLATHWRGIRDRLRLGRARRLLGDERFDVTVSFMEGAPARLHQLLLDRAPRNIAWIHTDIHRGRWYEFWHTQAAESAYYRSLDNVVFVSDDARRAFLEEFDTDAPLSVVLNPVDTDAIRHKAAQSASATAETRFTIVTIGRLIPLKRQQRLIGAARILKQRGHDFAVKIVGAGPLEAELRRAVDDAGVSDRVELTGFMANPFPTLAAADIFCLTSDVEGFGMVVAEALVLGVPVVSTPVTGVKEMLARGGGVFTDFSAESLADALERIMTRPDELARLRAEAAEAGARFDKGAIVEQVERLLS